MRRETVPLHALFYKEKSKYNQKVFFNITSNDTFLIIFIKRSLLGEGFSSPKNHFPKMTSQMKSFF
jgi:hypothetical protein